MSLTPGTRLGSYQVTAHIGEGGMGDVYRATDTSLGRSVAIKVLPKSWASDADRLARFKREAKTLASLNHPNIAQIYGFEQTDGIRALIMELAEGPGGYFQGRCLYGGTASVRPRGGAGGAGLRRWNHELSGSPVPVVERPGPGSLLSAASNGPMAYRSGRSGQLYIPRRFVWFDRSGKQLAQVGDPMVTGTGLSLSSDGRRLVVDAAGPDRGSNIWQLETDRGVRSRLTLHAAPVVDLSPVWSPDGNSVVFAANPKGVYDLYRKSLTGQGDESLLLATADLKVPSDVSGDGRFLLYTTYPVGSSTTNPISGPFRSLVALRSR